MKLAGLALLAVVLVGCGGPAKEATGQSHPLPGQRPSRVAVKHGLDPGAKGVNMTPKDITIEELMALERPSGIADDISDPDSQNRRIGDLENQVWRIKARVKSIVKRRDGDYFVTLEDPKSGATTVVEVPDPALCKGSPMEADISKSRADLEKRFHPGDKIKDVGQEATVTGVGFWGQTGRPGQKKTNGARLMPGLGFDWGG